MKDRETSLRFLEDKLRLIRPFLDPVFGAQLQQMYAHLWPNLHQVGVGKGIRLEDSQLEKRMLRCLTAEQIAKVKETLVTQYGFSRLGQDPEKILKRILSRNQIKSDGEAEIVIGRLADQLHPGFGSPEYIKLGQILATYETRAR